MARKKEYFNNDVVLQGIYAGGSLGTAGQVLKSDGVNVYWSTGTSTSAADVLAALITVDGPGSLLDSDFLDSQNGSYYLARANHTGTQTWSTITATPTTLTGYGISDAQPLDADLTSWAFITRASGFDTFATTPSGANLAALLTSALPVSKGGTNATAAGITAFNNITGYTAAGATGTTSTNLVFSTSPTLVTPVLGAATATTINGLTLTSSTGTLTITNAKTLSVSNTLTLTATDGSTLAIGTGGTLGTAAYTASSAYQPIDSDLTSWAAITRASGFDTFATTPSSANLLALLTDKTGTGVSVFATSPTLVTPVLGVASGTSLTLTGDIAGANYKATMYTVSVPDGTDAIDFCTVTNSNFSSGVRIMMTIHSSGYAQTKEYIAPVMYNGTAGAWHKCLPLTSTGPYSGNDAEIDVSITNQIATFRIRRTTGATAGTATILIEVGGDPAGTTIASSSTTYASATAAANYAPTSLTMRNGFTGINNDAPAAYLDIAGGTQTTSTPILNMTQTWNNVATTFTAAKINVTDTTSASGSLLFDAQVDGVSKFKIRKNGLLTIASSGIQVAAGSYYQWSNGTSIKSAADGIISLENNGTTKYAFLAVDEAANTLALRNSTAAQAFRIYNTYTDASNYERMALLYSSGAAAFQILSDSLGTGSARQLHIGTNTAAALAFLTNAVSRWNVTSTGNFIAGADNTYDIGALGATSARNIYASTKVVPVYLQFQSAGALKSYMQSSTDGIISMFDSAGTSFTRLQFGGTTSSFPAIARSGTNLQVLLADGSAFTSIGASTISLGLSNDTTLVRSQLGTLSVSSSNGTFPLVMSNDVVQPYNPFTLTSNTYTVKQLAHTITNNRFLGRSSQLYTTVDAVSNTTLNSRICDGDFEATVALGSVGGAAVVVNVNTVTNGLTGSTGFTYVNGAFWVHFYAGRHPSAMTARWKDQFGTWTAVTPTQEITYGAVSFGGNCIGWRIPVNGNYLTDIEITITPQTTGGLACLITEIEYQATRMGMTEGAFIGVGGGTYRGAITVTPSTTATVGSLLVALGSESTPAYSFSADTNTGLFSPSSDVVSLASGGTERVRVVSTEVRVPSTTSIGWTSATASSSLDTILGRNAAASFRLGAADAAAPVAQTLGVQSVVAGTTDTAGAAFTIAGSRGTGTGAGGSIIFQTAAASTTASTQNTLAAVLTLGADKSATFTGTITRTSGSYSHSIGANGYQFTVPSGADNEIRMIQTSIADVRMFLAATTGILTFTGLTAGIDVRNGATAQAFRVYNTYTDASNYERGAFDWVSNELLIRTASLGTGSNRSIVLQVGSAELRFQTGTTDRWKINASGHFLSGTDNTYDIGALGANRPRNLFVAGTGTFGSTLTTSTSISLGAGYAIAWASSTSVVAPSNGILTLYNNAQTDFSRLQLGGTTSSFPSFKRNGTGIDVRLADDSAYANVSAGQVLASDGTNSAPGFTFIGTTNTGMYRDAGGGRIRWTVGGTFAAHLGSTQFALISDTSSFAMGSLTDLILSRAAAASLQFGAADAAAPVAQTLGVQSVVAGTTNTAGATFTIKGSAGTGTGAGGNIVVQTSVAGLTGTAQNAPATVWTFRNDGHVAATANIFSGNLATGSGWMGAVGLAFYNRGYISAAADGVFTLLDNATTAFSRLQFGGTSASFPAIKRNGTAINFRLADDTADAAITAASFNKITLTTPATGSTLTIADGKTLTVSNTITLTATDGSTLAIGAGGTLGTAAYTAASAYQPIDSDLTTIAGLTATTGNFIQSSGSAWASRTPTQVTADLIVMVGDSGSGGTKGLVPAPATGDATKFLKGNGTWSTIPGGGDLLASNNLSELTATASTARSNLGLTIGTNVQAYSANLASWAAITRASGFDTFATTPSSANLLALLTDKTGTGVNVFATSPTLVTPVLGVATATSINGLTLTSSTGTVTITNAKTFSVSNTLTLTATDGSTLAIGAGGTLASAAYVATGTSGATIPLLNGTNTWSSLQTFSSGATLGGNLTVTNTAPFIDIIDSDAAANVGKWRIDASLAALGFYAYNDAASVFNAFMTVGRSGATVGAINFQGTALTYNSVAIPTISSTDTFTNKTLTSPVINTPTMSGTTVTSTSGITFNTNQFVYMSVVDPTATSGQTGYSINVKDSGGVQRISYLYGAQSVIYMQTPASGTFNVTALSGSATLQLNGVAVPTISSTDTLTNKTLTSPSINGAALSGTLSGAFTFSGAITSSSSLQWNSSPINSRMIGMPWAEMSSDAGGNSVHGNNIYANWDGSVVAYKTVNAHASVGYGAIRFGYGLAQITTFGGATTAGATVTPTWRSIATLDATETFTNKTLTSPTINSGTISGTITMSGTPTFSGAVTYSGGSSYFTNNGNNGPKFDNPYWSWTNAAGTRLGYIQALNGSSFTIVSEQTGSHITLGTTGGGLLYFNGVEIPTLSSTHTFTNKTLTSPTINSGTLNGSYGGTPTFTGGTLTLNASNHGIELGSTSAINTPFIDFHTTNSANDYDVRIIASGGTTVGTGTLEIAASALTRNSVAIPTISSTDTFTNKTLGATTVNALMTFTGTEGNQIRWTLGGQSWAANIQSAGDWYVHNVTSSRFPLKVTTASINDALVLGTTATFGVPITSTGTISSTASTGYHSNYASGAQGGSISFQKGASGNTLAGNVTIDINGNSMRIYEAGGSFRGIYFDLTTMGSQSALATDANTLTFTNKTLTTPTINGAALSGTLSGSPTFSGTPTFAGITMTGLLVGLSSSATDVNSANDTGSFSVRGSTTTVASMSFHRTGAYAINMGLGTDNIFRIGGWSASSNCLQLDGSGNLTALANISAYSDIKLKEDLIVIPDALAKVQTLTGYTYTRKDTKERQTGLIAQDVEKILPEAVSEMDGTKTLAYGNLMGLMVEAIKELKGELDSLRAEVKELKYGNAI